MPAEGRWPIGRRGGAPILLLAHRCCVGLAAGLCARRGGWTWTRWRPSPVLPKKCCRSRDGSYAYVCSKGGSWVSTTPCRTHGLKSGACRRPETERQGLPMRPSHDSVWRSESSLHTTGPPVLLNSIIGTPGGRYMRLVTPVRAPSIRSFAAPSSNRPKSQVTPIRLSKNPTRGHWGVHIHHH